MEWKEETYLESHEKGLALDERKGEVDASGVAIRISVSLNVLDLRRQPGDESIGEGGDSLMVELDGGEKRGTVSKDGRRGQNVKAQKSRSGENKSTYLHLLLGDPASLPQANDQRRRDRTASQPSLLSSPMDQRLQPNPRPPPHVRRPDPLWPIDLMSAHTQHVDAHLVHVDLDLPDGLGGVGVEPDALVSVADFADLFQGLDDADLVVDSHDGDEGGVGSDGGFELGKGDETVLLDGEVGDVEAVLGEVSARVEDALVLLLDVRMIQETEKEKEGRNLSD
jgi:hypothetical protein